MARRYRAPAGTMRLRVAHAVATGGRRLAVPRWGFTAFGAPFWAILNLVRGRSTEMLAAEMAAASSNKTSKLVEMGILVRFG
jgi:hypothetical protein